MLREREALAALGRAILQPGAPTPSQTVPVGGLRLEVYRYGFGARTKKALEHAYPRTSRALGAAWRELGEGYSRQVGPSVANLNDLGAGLAAYLRARRVHGGLVELAELEWAMVKATRTERLPAAGLDSLTDGTARLQPDVRLVQLRYASLEALATPDRRPRRLKRTAWVRVSTGPSGAWVRLMGAAEQRLARALAEGVSLGPAIERARLSEAALAQVLAAWVADGLLASPASRVGDDGGRVKAP